MRTPNCKCIICKTPLYRRPFELKKVKFTCCKGCRGIAYKLFPNVNSINNLELGREKGTNHLEGIPKSISHRNKMKKIMKLYCEQNPDKVKKRGIKTRGKNHYNWKGGASEINCSIRRLTEYRKWQQLIKKRDKKCMVCEVKKELESHHIISFKSLLVKYKINNQDDARNCIKLWNINNGITLCKRCHCKIHNRKYTQNGKGRRQNDNK